MSRSPTIIDDADSPEWLHNPHVGEILVSEFMEPSALDASTLGDAIGVPPARIAAVLAGERRLDAETDLRLARYFGMSEGFFLRLQTAHELEEAKRALNGALDAIVPRAA